MNIKPNTQKWYILKHLEKHGSITRMEAANFLYIFELSSRIGELEALGYVFKREQIQGLARSGKHWRGIKYSLTSYV